MLSSVNRSDYVAFLGVGVPSVFFSDATGPCYHTAQDELSVVDFRKLDQQIAIALDVTKDIAGAGTLPGFVANAPVATFDDALVLARVAERLWDDRDLFTAEDRALLATARTDIQGIIDRGRTAFDDAALGTLLSRAASTVSILTHGECDGFVAPPT